MRTIVYDDNGHECILLGFTGGDYNQWAIVTYGDRIVALPLNEVHWKDTGVLLPPQPRPAADPS